MADIKILEMRQSHDFDRALMAIFTAAIDGFIIRGLGLVRRREIYASVTMPRNSYGNPHVTVPDQLVDELIAVATHAYNGISGTDYLPREREHAAQEEVRVRTAEADSPAMAGF